MQKKLVLGLPGLVTLQVFTVFPEYFIGVSILYVLIVVSLITYNVYGLMLQKAVSECVALILLMSCYLLLNDDLIALNFSSFNHSIINDYLAFFAKVLICVFSAVYFLIIADSLKEQRLTSFEYIVVLLFAILGLILICSSNDLLTAYLAIELSSLASYVLASFKKTSSYSVEAGIKYFITGAVSSAFFLLGSSLIYGVTGSINFTDFVDLFERETLYQFPCTTIESWDDWRALLHSIVMSEIVGLPELFDYSFVDLGLTLILFSLFIKLALAPFHLWSLDVYEGSPISSTIFFAVIAKFSIFVLMIRLCYTSFFSCSDCWQFYSLWIGIFSIFVGSFGGLRQRRLKTLLAYSSTSHMGYSLLAFSTSTYLGIQALLFYMTIYMLSGLCMWSIILVLKMKKNSSYSKYNKELGDLTLLRKSNPSLAFALALSMFSIAGIPPLIGFLAKMNVFLSVMGASFYVVALISILCSVVSTFYYIRVIKILYFENLLVGKLYYPINTLQTLIISVLVLFLGLLFLNPTFLYLITYKVAMTLI